jgi:hypothetical protein
VLPVKKRIQQKLSGSLRGGLHAGVLLEPVGQAFGIGVGQPIDQMAPLQITEQGAVAAPPVASLFIHPQSTWPGEIPWRGAADLAQQRVAADLQAQSPGQPGPAPASPKAKPG